MSSDQLIWSYRAQVIGIIFALFFLVFVLNLVRNKRLLEEYSVLWLLLSIGILLLASWKGLLLKITKICGASDTTSILFFFGMICFLLLLLHFSIKVTKLTNHARDIAQQLAIISKNRSINDSDSEGETEKNNDTESPQ
ncbi:MAG: hypothetical protein A2161_14870 [Candidatus Schekmanbacteria bacterium RBG_13_48_7]|uniref:DUF2304 domain-containing protein n=1 Tax=Candidatus Schekmanbacteria bacterium RBG_13_48_7 TaxID=1817878 RepID=A0A1F7RZ60_9BACT|nr:MAG: hypothetical protein A2161_14870 [Candidatus Schekmanbacteria bacterium RBG_13_48_7]